MFGACRRDDFPALKDGLVYFDSAATTLKPHVVAQAEYHFNCYAYAPVHRSVYRLANVATTQYEQARLKVASFFQAPSDGQIVWTPGTTAGLNYLATFLPLNGPVYIGPLEHHANDLPWRRRCAQDRLPLRRIPVDAHGAYAIEPFLNGVTPDTALIALSHISNTTGHTVALETLIPRLREKAPHAFIVVDGAQGALHPNHAEKWLADFYLFSSHKIMGPTGLGVLLAHTECLEKLPPFFLGGQMVAEVTAQNATWAPAPLRFEPGTPPLSQVIGLAAAVDYIGQFSSTGLLEHQQQLGHYFCNKMVQEIPNFHQLSHNTKTAIVTFTIASVHPLDFATLMGERGFALRSGHHCSQTAMAFFGVEHSLRVAFTLYNTYAEIDNFVAHAQQVLALLTAGA